jgi:hypothetical protein
MTIIEQKKILIDAQDDLLKSHIKTFIANFQKMYIEIAHDEKICTDTKIYLRNILEMKIEIYRGLLASLNSLTTKAKVNG